MFEYYFGGADIGVLRSALQMVGEEELITLCSDHSQGRGMLVATMKGIRGLQTLRVAPDGGGVTAVTNQQCTANHQIQIVAAELERLLAPVPGSCLGYRISIVWKLGEVAVTVVQAANAGADLSKGTLVTLRTCRVTPITVDRPAPPAE